MSRTLIILLFLVKIVNAQHIEQPYKVLLALSDSGGLEINRFNVSDTDITLDALDSLLQARHYRISLTRSGLAYFIYPKYRLRVLCFVGQYQNYPVLIFLPIQNKEHINSALMINEITFSNDLSFDDIYYSASLQSIIKKSYYFDPNNPNKDVMVMCNFNNVCLELIFNKGYITKVILDVNSSLNN